MTFDFVLHAPVQSCHFDERLRGYIRFGGFTQGCWPAGNFWAAAADRLQAHFAILMVMYILGVLLRTSMMLAPDFTTMLVVVVAKEFCGSPVGIIVDATVLAASKEVMLTSFSTSLTKHESQPSKDTGTSRYKPSP